MELTGGAASRMAGGDEKSGWMREEVGSGCSVRVDLPTRRSRALHDEMKGGVGPAGLITVLLQH
jgi:hypothetical protein